MSLLDWIGLASLILLVFRTIICEVSSLPTLETCEVRKIPVSSRVVTVLTISSILVSIASIVISIASIVVTIASTVISIGVVDVWRVVNDYCGQAVGKLQAESMMSIAASLFSQ
jgi:hypothetical protein